MVELTSLTPGPPATEPRRLESGCLLASLDRDAPRGHSLPEGCKQCCVVQIPPKHIPTNCGHAASLFPASPESPWEVTPRVPGRKQRQHPGSLLGASRQSGLLTPETPLSGLPVKTPTCCPIKISTLYLKSSPDLCGSVSWTSSPNAKGHRFDFQLGHVPGSGDLSPVRAHTRGN